MRVTEQLTVPIDLQGVFFQYYESQWEPPTRGWVNDDSTMSELQIYVFLAVY